jgi:putative lipoprotein
VALPGRAQAADDAWWGKDKQKHLLLSSGAAFVTYVWLGHSGMEPSLRMGATALVVLGVGALKEARDALGYGHASWKDMTWNVIGTAVGLIVAWVVERCLWPKSPWVPRWVP